MVRPAQAKPGVGGTQSTTTLTEPAAAKRVSRPPVAAPSNRQSGFEPGSTAVTSGGNVPATHGSVWGSPLLPSLQQAITDWTVPAPGTDFALGAVLPSGDPRLRPTIELPGREAWRIGLTQLVVSAGAKKEHPTAYYLAGPMGVGKIALANKLYEDGVLPTAVVKADADYLHGLVPEQSQLLSIGEGRASDIVHEEASTIARNAYFQALDEKRDVVHNSMLETPAHLERLDVAEEKGFKRSVLALVAPLDVAKERAGGGGALFPVESLISSHRNFANNFDEIVKRSDELVLMMNWGTRFEVIAEAKNGELTVLNPNAFEQFRAQRQLQVEHAPAAQ